jgi:catechol 2,3-dioxygenase-like lactoylglutathione lyase family enzyme
MVPATMPRIDHVAVETDDPDATATFYEELFGARTFHGLGGTRGLAGVPGVPFGVGTSHFDRGR